MHSESIRSLLGVCAALVCLPAVLPAQTPAPPKAKPAVVKRAGKPAANAKRGHKAPAGAKHAPAKPAAASVVTVKVRPTSEVNGDSFTLGAIADITGGDKALRAQLTAMEMGTSPLPGLSRPLFPGEVTVRLRANHLESARVKVDLPLTLRVTRTANSVASDDITKAAIAAAQTALKDIPDLTLEPTQPIEKIVAPAGKLVILAGVMRGTPEQGTVTVPISVLVDGKPTRTIDVALRVHRRARVLVARRVVEPMEILSASDVDLASVELPEGFTQPILTVKAAVGKRARRRLMADMPITETALETPPAINANDRITIEFVYGTVHVTAPGLARQQGAVGDTIRVFAVDTQKELDGVIVDGRTVRIADEDDGAPAAGQDDAADTGATETSEP